MKKLQIGIDRARLARYVAGAIVALVGALQLWEHPSVPISDAAAGSLALFGALLLFSWRNFIEIDPGTHRIAHRIGFLFVTVNYGARFDTRLVRRISLGETQVEETDGEGDSRTVTHYALRINGATGGVLCTHRDFWAIRHVAERISRALRIELETHLFGSSSVRTSEVLDLPLAERWRRAGVLERPPRLEGMKQLVVENEGDSSEVSLPIPPGPRTAAVIALVGISGSLYAASSIWEVPALLLVGIGALAASVIGHLVLQSTGRRRLRFTGTDVEVRHGLLPFVERIRIDDVEELLESRTQIALLGDRGYVVFEQPSEADDRAILRQFVERQIGQRQRKPRSESRPSA